MSVPRDERLWFAAILETVPGAACQCSHETRRHWHGKHRISVCDLCACTTLRTDVEYEARVQHTYEQLIARQVAAVLGGRS